MINPSILRRLFTYAIASVWLLNGLYCKVLNGVPRHERIVARILGGEYAHLLTKVIGFSEILMAIWVVSTLWPRRCALVQIGLIATMNTLEFVLAPDLLLFGRLNALNALLFIGIIYYNEFFPASKPVSQN